jgi:hypothetical protein
VRAVKLARAPVCLRSHPHGLQVGNRIE